MLSNLPQKPDGKGWLARIAEAIPLKQTVVTAVSLAMFGGFVTCVIAAGPRQSEPEAMLTGAPDREPIRIEAPVTDRTDLFDDYITAAPDTSLPSPEDEEPTPVTTAEALKVSAPETTKAPELPKPPETTAPAEPVTAPEIIPAPETVKPPEATKEPETTKAPEPTYAPVPPQAPETTKAPETTAAPVKTTAPKSNLLVDELFKRFDYVIEKPKFTVTDYEIRMCATVIQLEVMGNGQNLYWFDDPELKYWEMLAVANCIRNRVEDKQFPNSVSGVIFQSHTLSSGRVIYQFSPASKLEQFTPTEEALRAAREVLCEGVRNVPTDYQYFCSYKVETSFQKGNDYSLAKNPDGTYDKIRGHQTIFYAGR